MMHAFVRATSVLAALVTACVMAFAGDGLSAWMTVAMSAGGLTLAGAVLFWPSETPARRLAGLIQAWRGTAQVETPRSDR